MTARNTHRRWLIAVAAMLWAAPAGAEIPGTVTVEGALTSVGGGPVADGSYSVLFSLYDKPVGGAPAWSGGPVTIQTVGGRFSHALGSKKALDAAKLAALPAQWLGLKVGSDPELLRRPLSSTFFALWARRAGGLTCSGCVGAGQLAKDAVPAAKVGFLYAGSDTKGGPALKARALDCTGCVTVAQLKFDKDVDLGARGLKTSGTVAAGSFVGDGSKLTGIRIPSGDCPGGRAVGGIDAAGKLKCVLAGGSLETVSSGLFTRHFSDTFTSSPGTPIPDFNNNGVLDTIAVPDLGTAEKLEVRVEISKAPFVDANKDGKPDYDPTDLTVLLFAPTTKALPAQRSNVVNDFLSKPTVKQSLYPNYVLHQGTGAGALALIGTWPTKTKLVFGDLGAWIGKNPKGNWRLFVLDNKDRKNPDGSDAKTDGKLVKWSVTVGYESAKQVQVNGGIVFNESGSRVRGARIKQARADALADGKILEIATGTSADPLIAQAWFWNATSKLWVQANAGSAAASNCSACGTGTDGDYKPSGNTTIGTSKIWNFKDFIIPKGITVTASGTAPLRIHATGRVEIQGSLKLDGGTGGNVTNSSNGCYNGQSSPGKGGPGGYDGGYGVYNRSSNGFYDGKGPGYGRRGAYNWSGGCGSGGGGAGHGGTGASGQGSAGAGGGSYTSIDANNLRGGSGGGAGGYGSWKNATGAGGGGGGGALELIGAEVRISGLVSANGGNGGRQYNGCDGGDGGGGAGGAIWIRGGKVDLSGATIRALGGSGGSAGCAGSGCGNECGGNGGNGAVGRVRVDSKKSITGTTNPKYTRGSDTGLAPPVANKFSLEHTEGGRIRLTNHSGAPQKVRLVVSY